jgi:hypothetical protein
MSTERGAHHAVVVRDLVQLTDAQGRHGATGEDPRTETGGLQPGAECQAHP